MSFGNTIGNIGTIMKLKGAWDTFTRNHPRFPAFLGAIKCSGIHEGDIIAISVTDTAGRVTETNLRVSRSDLELFDSLSKMAKEQNG